ncbi:MAG: class I SAM-dependent methyltransferase [Candidatus Scalindua sp.]
MKANPFLKVREQVESSSNNPQDLNRRWWERMPMTYVDWGMNERDLSEHKAFHEVQKAFLQNNHWVIENIDFAEFRNQRVLEIGCGSGAAAYLFANARASVTAIDITETDVRLANACAEACGVHISVNQMDAEQTSFNSGSFDYIFS